MILSKRSKPFCWSVNCFDLVILLKLVESTNGSALVGYSDKNEYSSLSGLSTVLLISSSTDFPVLVESCDPLLLFLQESKRAKIAKNKIVLTIYNVYYNTKGKSILKINFQL